jgi:hypothetical protein
MSNQTPPPKPPDTEQESGKGLDETTCSLLVDCTEDVEEFRARKPHNRFCAWKGRDFWHKNISVQIRLEPDGSVFLSTQEGHVSTLRIATITIEQLHATIRSITANREL